MVYRFWDMLHENSSTGKLVRLGLFIFLYFIGRYIQIFFDTSDIFLHIRRYFHQPFQWFIDMASTSFWGIFYQNIHSTKEFVILINNKEIIQLQQGCSGFQSILRMTIILLLYPLSWKIKSWLFPLSWMIILLAATIHFIILIPITCHFPEYYSFSHNWGTRVIFYGFYFLTWLIWERIGYPKKKMIRETR